MKTRVAFAAVAVGAALLGGAGHAVGTAPSAGADTGTDLDPFADLYGDTGFNSWTTTADTDLATLSPTLTSDLATSVDNFETGFYTLYGSVSFTELADALDPSAFSVNPDGIPIPDNAIGDFATGLDYTLFASGLGSLDADVLILLGPLFVDSI